MEHLPNSVVHSPQSLLESGRRVGKWRRGAEKAAARSLAVDVDLNPSVRLYCVCNYGYRYVTVQRFPIVQYRIKAYKNNGITPGNSPPQVRGCAAPERPRRTYSKFLSVSQKCTGFPWYERASRSMGFS